MQSLEAGGEGGAGDEDEELPSRAEDVDKFMKDLAAAAAGGAPAGELPPVRE